jgi:hypothetical protein
MLICLLPCVWWTVCIIYVVQLDLAIGCSYTHIFCLGVRLGERVISQAACPVLIFSNPFVPVTGSSYALLLYASVNNVCVVKCEEAWRERPARCCRHEVVTGGGTWWSASIQLSVTCILYSSLTWNFSPNQYTLRFALRATTQPPDFGRIWFRSTPSTPMVTRMELYHSLWPLILDVMTTSLIWTIWDE